MKNIKSNIKEQLKSFGYSISSIYADLPHIHYVKTNYGDYPDTLVTRLVRLHLKRTCETDYDLEMTMLEIFQTTPKE